MSADDSREDLFVALRVLSRVTANDRISTTTGSISLDNASWRGIQWLQRWWSGDKREVNIDRTRKVFGAMCMHVQTSADLYEAWSQVASRYNMPVAAEKYNMSFTANGGGLSEAIQVADLRARMEESKNFITRALEAMEAAAQGVQNLCTTYKSDDNISARIEELVLNVRALTATTRKRVGISTQPLVQPLQPATSIDTLGASLAHAQAQRNAEQRRPVAKGRHPMYATEDSDADEQ
jgi:hypothetical protein